ncbi:MAG: AIM24 family protein [Thermoplasmata archaeon]|nr:AIM24 family protein [Thermoplasmata archaeon]
MKADTVGGITPAVLVQLRPGEKILAAHEIMLYKEGTVKLARRTLKSLGVSTTHMLALRAQGDSEESYFLAEFEGPGSVTFSRDKAGEVRIVELAAGQTMRLRQGHIICFDPTVKYNPIVLLQYPSPTPNENGQRPTVYVFADELTGPGTIVFQSIGNILSFTLGPQESLRTSVNALLAVGGTNRFALNWLAPGQMAGNVSTAVPVIDVTGPGVVMVHSGW